MYILKLVLLAIFKIAFFAALKIALLLYVLFLPGAAYSPREQQRVNTTQMLRQQPNQCTRELLTT